MLARKGSIGHPFYALPSSRLGGRGDEGLLGARKNFLNGFNKTTRRANHPKVCQAPFRSQYSDFQKPQTGLYSSHPVPLRGAFRERHERGAGMRWTQAARETGVLAGGRPNRVVLTPRRWCQVRATERGRRWPKGPEHRGDHEATVKTIAQGKSDCLRWTCMLVCAFLCANCTRDRGCSVHPAFPAPSDLERAASYW